LAEERSEAAEHTASRRAVLSGPGRRPSPSPVHRLTARASSRPRWQGRQPRSPSSGWSATAAAAAGPAVRRSPRSSAAAAPGPRRVCSRSTSPPPRSASSSGCWSRW